MTDGTRGVFTSSVTNTGETVSSIAADVGVESLTTAVSSGITADSVFFGTEAFGFTCSMSDTKRTT